MQLFHLRMYDLGKREFSLRRYGRDSGREVCHSKRLYEEPAPEGRPTLQRSMTHAIRNLNLSGKPAFRRTNTSDSKASRKTSKSSKSSKSSGYQADPSRYQGDYFADGGYAYADANAYAAANTPGGHSSSSSHGRKAAEPTNTIKLEFSNYARVDIRRRGGKGSKRYEFEWWGHKYTWKRVAEKHLGRRELPPVAGRQGQAHRAHRARDPVAQPGPGR